MPADLPTPVGTRMPAHTRKIAFLLGLLVASGVLIAIKMLFPDLQAG